MGRDHIGKRGEWVAATRLMDPCGNPDPYFDPHYLGEKCSTFDYLVELVNAGDSPPYFLAQVKVTRKGRTKGTRRLIAGVTSEDVRRMARCPLPTYLLGVDEPREKVFIVSVHGGMTGAIASMPTTYPLTPKNLRRLWEEVVDYWGKLEAGAKTSVFTFKG
jgi:hypothetical protein